MAKNKANNKKALLIMNLGTPDAPTEKALRPYLREFLMDPYVVDIAWPLRAALIYGVILRKRPAESAKAYKSIWTERGSPLLFHTQDLCEKLRKKVKNDFSSVDFAMRYNKPSVRTVLKKILSEHPDLSELTLVPLYPQYALASTESSIQKVKREWLALTSKLHKKIPIEVIGDFFDFPPYIAALAKEARGDLSDFKADHLLMSFHGVPERHVKKCDPSGAHCLKAKDCCARIVPANRLCYRAQSYATARLLASALGLKNEQYSVAFQSRLGRTPWIKPYTDEIVVELAQKGVRKLAVVVPSFVADCLETIEEIGDRAREDFIKAGGEDLRLLRCLNSSDSFVGALASLIERTHRAPLGDVEATGRSSALGEDNNL